MAAKKKKGVAKAPPADPTELIDTPVEGADRGHHDFAAPNPGELVNAAMEQGLDSVREAIRGCERAVFSHAKTDAEMVGRAIQSVSDAVGLIGDVVSGQHTEVSSAHSEADMAADGAQTEVGGAVHAGGGDPPPNSP